MKAKIFFDGSAYPNPGTMRIGVVVETPERTIEISKDLGEGTNNAAEYMALITGLEKALELGVSDVEIYGDSKLVVEQVKGNFKVKNEKLKRLRSKVMELLSNFRNWCINWISEKENKRAHELSRFHIE